MKEATRLLEPLLQRQREFLGFLQSRLGTEEAARDALQSACVKAMKKADTIRDDDCTVAWFYRLLRNARVRGTCARHGCLDCRCQEQRA